MLSITIFGWQGAGVCAPHDVINRPDWGIGGFRPPPRWEVQAPDRPTYPQLLGWAARGADAEQAVITLVARRIPPGASVQDFAAQSATLLPAAGLRDIHRQVQLIDAQGWGGRRVQLDAALGGRRVIRQLFYVANAVGYVLTLVAPQSQALPRLRDLEDTAANLAPLKMDEAPH